MVKINSTLIERAIVQANLRTLATGATRWAALTEPGDYTAGYHAGYIAALEQIAQSIEVDAGIETTTGFTIAINQPERIA